MIDLKPGQYALGLIEGYLETAAKEGDPGAEQILEAVTVVDTIFQDMAKEYSDLQLKIMQLKPLVDSL